MSGIGLALRYAQVSKRYGSVEALRPTDLEVRPGEFLTLLGPSGSGKTTLLNLTAGYLEPTGGQVFIGERDVTRVPARRRNVGMVFQNYALFPHMSVEKNVAYGLKVRGVPKAEIERRVDAALQLVQLGDFGKRSIQQMSGGQQQRVALARALVIEPDVLLMDEPLGALDRQLRKTVQLEIRRLHEAHRRTTIYVTHDQEEALVLSDRVAVMRDGRVVQIGTAAELYGHPADVFVAGFIGESNLLPAKVTAVRGQSVEAEVPALGRRVVAPALPGIADGSPAKLLIRPEHLTLDGAGDDGRDGVEGTVEESVYLGELLALAVVLPDGTKLWVRRFADREIPRGARVRVGWQPDALRVLPER